MGKKAAEPTGAKSRLRFVLLLFGGANLALALTAHMESLRESWFVQFYSWFYSQWWILALSVLLLSPAVFELYEILSYRSRSQVAAANLKHLRRRLRRASRIARGPFWYPGLGRQEREIELASELLHSVGAAACPILSLDTEAQRKWVSSYFRILADTIDEHGVEQAAQLNDTVASFLNNLFPDAKKSAAVTRASTAIVEGAAEPAPGHPENP